LNKSLSHDFQIVLLCCGKSRRLGSFGQQWSKCLLPIANRTLLSYQLEMFSKYGFSEVIIITNSLYSESILNYTKSIEKEGLKIIVEVIDDFCGTATALLRIRDRLTKDFIVMSGDLIVDDSFLYVMADSHRIRDGAVSVLLYPNSHINNPKKKKENIVVNFVGLNEDNRLVYFVSSSDFKEDDSGKLKIKKSLLKRFPKFTLFTKYRDAHFYIFSNWTLAILDKYKSYIQSIKSDFIPFLLRCQYRNFLLEDIEIPNNSLEIRNMSSTNFSGDKIICLSHIMNEGFCLRANTIDHYMEMNRIIATGILKYLPLEPGIDNRGQISFVSPTAQIHEKTIIPSGCVIGENSKLGERVGIKNSIIGKNCTIEDSVRIANSVIMDNVIIKTGSKITNSIICKDVTIKESVQLENAQVGNNIIIEPNESIKDTTIFTQKEEKKLNFDIQ